MKKLDEVDNGREMGENILWLEYERNMKCHGIEPYLPRGSILWLPLSCIITIQEIAKEEVHQFLYSCLVVATVLTK